MRGLCVAAVFLKPEIRNTIIDYDVSYCTRTSIIRVLLRHTLEASTLPPLEGEGSGYASI